MRLTSHDAKQLSEPRHKVIPEFSRYSQSIKDRSQMLRCRSLLVAANLPSRPFHRPCVSPAVPKFTVTGTLSLPKHHVLSTKCCVPSIGLLVRFLFGFLNRNGDALSSIIGEGLPANTQDHVIDLQHAIRRRLRSDMRDQNLPTGRRGPALKSVEVSRGPRMNPSAQAGGTKVVGSLAIHRAILRQVGRRL